MIGQTKLRQELSQLILNNKLPHLMIFCGEKGSGKRTLAHYVSALLDAVHVDCDRSVDAVREVIEASYKCTLPTVYVIPEIEKASIQAQNALLKITEEPPRSAYFILTTQNSDFVPYTIKSRGRLGLFYMEPYTEEELVKYADGALDSEVLEIARTPGDIEELKSMNTKAVEFTNFCNNVFYNLGIVSGPNALKITQYFKLKEHDEGYSPDLFFKAMLTKYCAKMRDTDVKSERNMYCDLIGITVTAMYNLTIPGLRKDSIIDMWIMQARRAIFKWEGDKE